MKASNELIFTSVFISHQNLIKLQKTYEKTQIPLNDIIKRILFLEIKAWRKSFQSGSVSYQHALNKNGKIIQIRVHSELYEMCLDLRKFGKRSVSLILAQAINKFLHKVKDFKFGVNNYTQKYLLQISNSFDATIFEIIWKKNRHFLF